MSLNKFAKIVCLTLAFAVMLIVVLYLVLPFIYMASTNKIVAGMLDNKYIDDAYKGWGYTQFPSTGNAYFPEDWEIIEENSLLSVYAENKRLAIGDKVAPNTPDSNVDQLIIAALGFEFASKEQIYMNNIFSSWPLVELRSYMVIGTAGEKAYVYCMELAPYTFIFPSDGEDYELLEILEAIAFSFEWSEENNNGEKVRFDSD